MQDGQELIFTGGLDTDSDLRYLKEGDYRAMANGRLGEAKTGNYGAAISVQGNLLVDNVGVSIGTVIGSCAINTPSENAIIYAVFATNGQHQLWKYGFTTGLFTKVYQSPLLNFQSHKKIYHMFVIDDLLYWSDNWFVSFLFNVTPLLQFNPPRKLNLSKAIAFTAGSPGGYTAIDFQTLDLIKYPHIAPPTATFDTDPDQETNHLYGISCKFAVQYVFDDHEVSVLSPHSKLADPTTSEFITGRNWLDPLADNVIDVGFNTGHEIVTSIRFFVSINDGGWYLWEEKNKAEEGWGNNATESIPFYNNSVLKPISTELATKPYDRVYQVCGGMELLPSRQLALTNGYEGYDLVVPDVSVLRTLTELVDFRAAFPEIRYQRPNATDTTIYTTDTAFGFLEGDIVQFSFYVAANTTYETFYYEITAADILAVSGMTDADAIDYIMEVIGDDIATQLGTVGSYNPATNTYTMTYGEGSLDVIYFVEILRRTNAFSSLQTGVIHEVAFQYYDRANRSGTVIPVGEIKLALPPTEDRYGFINENNPYTVAITLEIEHFPPDWSDYYQVLMRKKTSVVDFQWRTGYIQDTGNGRFKISLEKWYLDHYGLVTAEGATGGAKINHRPQEGDTVSFIRKVMVENTSDPQEYCSEIVELTVLQYSPNEGIGATECIWVPEFDHQSVLNTDSAHIGSFLMKIATPKKVSEIEATEPWHEIGVKLDILNPHTANRYHQGISQNQNALLPAIVELDYGDIYVRPRPMGTFYTGANNPYAIWMVEDPHRSDYYISNFNDIGRPGFEDSDARRIHKKASGIHSNAYVQNTLTNGLSSFDFDITNVFNLDEQYGSINKTIMVGYTLKCLQDRKETSVYINRVPYVGSDGKREFSEKTFGGINPCDTLYGCIYPGTAAILDGNLTYYDWFSGKVIRSYPNSEQQEDLTEPEKYKVSVLFDEIKTVTLIGDPEDYYGIAFVDEANHEYLLFFTPIDYTTPVGYGIVFSWAKDRWMSQRVGQIVVWAQNLGEQLVTFLNEDMYLENEGAELEFNGNPSPFSVSPVLNKYPVNVKRPLSMGIKSNQAPLYATMETLPDGNFANGQDTTMIVFGLREGAYWTRILRDSNSPNFSPVGLALYNGRELRNAAFEIDVVFDNVTDKVIVHSVKTMFTMSEAVQ